LGVPKEHWLLHREAEKGSRQDNWGCPGCAHLNNEQEPKGTLNPLRNNSYT